MNGRRLLGWAAGMAAVALTVAVLAGGVDLPDVESWLREAGPALGSWSYALVAGLAFLETAAFIGLLVPGEITIALGGFIAGQGVIDLVPLVACVWVAAVAGDTLSYLLGRRLGRDVALRYGRPLGLSEQRLVWAERFFSRHGGKTILLGRFVGVLRSVVPLAAGVAAMPVRHFLLVDTIGGGLWAAALCALGYAFWHVFDRVIDVLGHGTLVLVGCAVAACVALAARQLRRPPRAGTAV